MKLLISTFVTLLLIGFAGSSYGLDIRTIYYPNGDNYLGEFKDDQRNGKGTYTWAVGDIYAGEWKDDQRTGQGTYTFANGNVYVGEFRDTKLNGQGTFTYANGNAYIGEWRDNERIEKGIYTFSNGNAYIGEWSYSEVNRQGTYTFASEDVYVVEYKNDLRNGQGTFTYGPGDSEGDVYVGEFKDNERNGQGTYIYADGTVINGVWLKNTFVVANNIAPVTEAPLVGQASRHNNAIEASRTALLPKLDKTWPAEQWPLTVDSGELNCYDGNQLLFASAGTTYNINGVRTENKYADVMTIWKAPEEFMYNGQMLEGPRIGMVLLDEVSELCASRGQMYVGVNSHEAKR